MSSILLDNFAKPFGLGKVWNDRTEKWELSPEKWNTESYNWEKQSTAIAFGWQTPQEIKSVQRNAISKLFLCTLLFDEIYLPFADFESLYDFLGAKDSVALLSEGIIKPILNPTFVTCNLSSNAYEISPMTYIAGLMARDEGFIRYDHIDKKFQRTWRFWVNESSIELDYNNDFLATISNEIESDLNNAALTKNLGLVNSNSGLVGIPDKLKALRIANILNGLILQRQTHTDCLLQESFSESYVKSKILINNNGNTITNAFKDVLAKKAIPDLYYLYAKRAITISDLLRIRDRANALKFRCWIKDIDYNESDFYRTILENTAPSFNQKLIRFIYPTIFGLTNSSVGIFASAFDSIFGDKIFKSWHPSFFLDDILANFLNEHSMKAAKIEKKAYFESKYGHLGRNDECICGSGKKFKKCHGKEFS